MNVDEISAQAKKEIAEEEFRKAVEAEKFRILQRRSLLARIFPWKIIIKRR